MSTKYDYRSIITAESEPSVVAQWTKGAVIPRPIAMVGTRHPETGDNVAPHSHFALVSANPPIVMVATMRRETDGSQKDTATNIIATGEFTISMVPEEMAVATNQASAPVAPDVSEFDYADLTPLDGQVVNAPFVAGSPIVMECRVREGSGSPLLLGTSDVFFGDVVALQIREDFPAEAKFPGTDRYRPISRLGAQEWALLGEVFTQERPS